MFALGCGAAPGEIIPPMNAARVALVTCEKLPLLPLDEHLLVRALAERGVRAEPAVWSDSAVRWQDYGAVVVRSTWDYHHRLLEFVTWADGVAASGAALWNPAPLLYWNAEKTYLRDLAARGINVVPTRYVTPREPVTLAALLAEEHWERAIVKPTVSATAFGTFQVDRSEAASHEERFRALCTHGGVMVQPYLASIETDGEWSLCFVTGEFSHAILKRPKSGDFRVQLEFGGSAEQQVPPEWLVAQARHILDLVDGPWLYARVDGCLVDGSFQLIELEMIEPSLFLDRAPAAAPRMADAIVGVLNRKPS